MTGKAPRAPDAEGDWIPVYPNLTRSITPVYTQYKYACDGATTSRPRLIDRSQPKTLTEHEDPITGNGDRDGSPTVPARRYRHLLALVDELETPSTIDELVDPVFARECGGEGRRPSKSWSDVHEELYLIGLPALDRIGLLEFDAQRGIVDAAPGSRSGRRNAR